MYGTSDHAQMPDEFLTDPAAWDQFIGQVWHAVTAPLAIPATGAVIEIAPGSSAKIAHALALGGFCGTLHLVEPAARALDIALGKYRSLLPDATVIPHCAALDVALKDLPRGADALLASHVLDDMLLAQAAHSTTFDWAVSYSSSVSAGVQVAWSALSASPARQTQAIATTCRDMCHAVQALAPRHVVFSQYPSATLRDHALDALNDAACDVLDGITDTLRHAYHHHDCATTLGRLPHYHNTHIGTHVLNPRYWLACTQLT